MDGGGKEFSSWHFIHSDRIYCYPTKSKIETNHKIWFFCWKSKFQFVILTIIKSCLTRAAWRFNQRPSPSLCRDVTPSSHPPSHVWQSNPITAFPSLASTNTMPDLLTLRFTDNAPPREHPNPQPCKWHQPKTLIRRSTRRRHGLLWQHCLRVQIVTRVLASRLPCCWAFCWILPNIRLVSSTCGGEWLFFTIP